MLETFVPSKVRRTLLEYLLTHTTDRFYLRGLAKTLQLPISPLRRELKRLEQASMLRSAEEGNMLFYTIHVDSPAFQQLQGALIERTEAPSAVPLKAEGSRLQVVTSSLQPPASSLQSPPVIPLGVISASPKAASWRSPLSSPALLAATGVGMSLVLIVAGLFYLTMTNRHLVAQTDHLLSIRKAQVTVVTPPTPSGVMRGSRWQVVPGGFGGFSNGTNNESY